MTAKSDFHLVRTLFNTVSYHFAAVIYVSGGIYLRVGICEASRKIHSCLLRSVLRLPMSFFDVNPVGRLLSRFSRDIETVDSSLPGSIYSCLFMGQQVSWLSLGRFC
jgi:ABC-type multidrug transport system fused ATPase/permease subunit